MPVVNAVSTGVADVVGAMTGLVQSNQRRLPPHPQPRHHTRVSRTDLTTTDLRSTPTSAIDRLACDHPRVPVLTGDRSRLQGAGSEVSRTARTSTASYRRTTARDNGLSDKRAEPGQRSADDQGVHFPGALVGVDGLGVGDKPADVVVEDDAVAAEQFACVTDGLAHPYRAERFGQRRMPILGKSLV